jgi:hypothetical protein
MAKVQIFNGKIINRQIKKVINFGKLQIRKLLEKKWLKHAKGFVMVYFELKEGKQEIS